MGTVTRFEDLEVWQHARRLGNLIYELTSTGAFARDFGLRDQIRRAAVSVLSNIAEGFESRTQMLFVEFLGRAKASSGELRAQLYMALDQSYLTQDEFNAALALAQTCSKQLTRFIQYLESQPNARRIKEDHAVYDV